MNNSVFRSNMENEGKGTIETIRIVTADKRRKKLSSEPNNHYRKASQKNVLAIEMYKMSQYIEF